MHSCCPNCDYCPTCGRAGQWVRPWRPYIPPHRPTPYWLVNTNLQAAVRQGQEIIGR